MSAAPKLHEVARMKAAEGGCLAAVELISALAESTVVIDCPKAAAKVEALAEKLTSKLEAWRRVRMAAKGTAK